MLMHCRVFSFRQGPGRALVAVSRSLIKGAGKPVLIAAGLILSASAGADYETGLKAYSEKDYDQAVSEWSAPDMANDPRALFALGVMYMRGVGVDAAMDQGAAFYRRAADLGYASAQYNLGLAYFNGRGVEKDVEQSAAWWRKAADQGHAVAQYNLGAILWSGNGVVQDQAEGMHWFREAKTNGSRDAADFLLTLFAPMYRELDSQNLAAAQEARSLRDGAGAGIPLVDEFGAYRLGMQAMQSGQYDQAFKYWKPLADNGHVDSQFQIAQLLEHGRGVDKDFDQALAWYERAAQKGQGEAQYRLGMYYMNESPEPNEALGFYWIQSAADNDSAEAAKFIENL